MRRFDSDPRLQLHFNCTASTPWLLPHYTVDRRCARSRKLPTRMMARTEYSVFIMRCIQSVMRCAVESATLLRFQPKEPRSHDRRNSDRDLNAVGYGGLRNRRPGIWQRKVSGFL